VTGTDPGEAPDPGDAEAHAAYLEAGRLLFAQECTFLGGAVDDRGLPGTDIPEIAFAGRSNVGKSSLVNALTGRKTLARTSNTPGRTRELNFFDLGGRLRLVDLPGYGYAKAARSEVKAWNRLILYYLQGRPNLRRVCLLIDTRHGVKPNDEEIMALLDRDAVSYQLVMTKADKLPAGPLAAQIAAVAAAGAKHVACHPEVLATSARTGAGVAELRAALASMALGD
jgi:GTP-binding protein